MTDEYDFAKAERGKFFREGARLVPPVHLEPEVLDYLAERASARGGIVRARALFGARRPALLDELTDTMVA